MLLACDDAGEDVPFSAVCLRCASANCFSASCEGSFRDRKPRTLPDFFFFLDDDLESLEEDALEAVEARLPDVRLAVSNDCR
jgi:hypothetical protein